MPESQESIIPPSGTASIQEQLAFLVKKVSDFSERLAYVEKRDFAGFKGASETTTKKTQVIKKSLDQCKTSVSSVKGTKGKGISSKVRPNKDTHTLDDNIATENSGGSQPSVAQSSRTMGGEEGVGEGILLRSPAGRSY